MKVKERRNKMTNRQKCAVYYAVQKRKREGFEKLVNDYSLNNVDLEGFKQIDDDYYLQNVKFKYKQLQRNIDIAKVELLKRYNWREVLEILERYNLM